jgi:hypothetical protein
MRQLATDKQMMTPRHSPADLVIHRPARSSVDNQMKAVYDPVQSLPKSVENAVTSTFDSFLVKYTTLNYDRVTSVVLSVGRDRIRRSRQQ